MPSPERSRLADSPLPAIPVYVPLAYFPRSAEGHLRFIGTMRLASDAVRRNGLAVLASLVIHAAALHFALAGVRIVVTLSAPSSRETASVDGRGACVPVQRELVREAVADELGWSRYTTVRCDFGTREPAIDVPPAPPPRPIDANLSWETLLPLVELPRLRDWGDGTYPRRMRLAPAQRSSAITLRGPFEGEPAKADPFSDAAATNCPGAQRAVPIGSWVRVCHWADVANVVINTVQSHIRGPWCNNARPLTPLAGRRRTAGSIPDRRHLHREAASGGHWRTLAAT